MPADSERALPELPVTYRPFGVRIAVYVFGGLLVLCVVVVFLALPKHAQEAFTWLQKGTVIAMMLMGAVVGHALARCRVDATIYGLTVVNGYSTYRLDWSEVVEVSLRPGNPWAVLDLTDGTTRSVMGIQGSDGNRALSQARELHALIEAHAGAEPAGPDES